MVGNVSDMFEDYYSMTRSNKTGRYLVSSLVLKMYTVYS